MLNEKTLELNISAEFLRICRNYDHQSFMLGITLRREKYRGYDSEVFGRLPQFWRAAVFQFKKALRFRRKTPLGPEYKFQINNNGNRDQHLLLYLMSGGRAFVSLYVLPMFITLADVRNQAPNLLQKTYFADARAIPPSLINRATHSLLAYPQKLFARVLSNEQKIDLYPFGKVVMAIEKRELGITIEELQKNLRTPKEAEFKSKRPRFTFQIFPNLF